MAERYITDREFPDKAIDILDEAGARAQVVIKPPKEIVELEKKLVDLKEKKLETRSAKKESSPLNKRWKQNRQESVL